MNIFTGFICHNNSELVRDGYIYPSISREYYISSDEIYKWEARIEGSTIKGTRYIPFRDDNGKLYKVIERRQQLPARKISIELLFSKTMRNAVSHPIKPGGYFGGVGSTIGQMFAAYGMGGITSSTTDMTYHICDSETIINYPIIVTEELKETGIYKSDEYFMSVYGIVKEHELEEEEEEEEEEDYNSLGLNFSEEQLNNIGKYSLGVYQGGPVLRVTGATGSKGQFGGAGNIDVKIEDVMFDDQKNLFREIVYDDRIFKFRGDNLDTVNWWIEKQYPFRSKSRNDITSQSIKIDVSDLEVGDKLYITMCLASERRVRQCVRHRGSVGQGNTIGVVGWNMAIGSEVDVFDFKINKWMSPINDIIEEEEEEEELNYMYWSQGYTLFKNKYIISIDKLIEKSLNELVENFATLLQQSISSSIGGLGLLREEALLVIEQVQEFIDDFKKEREKKLSNYEEIEGWRESSINSTQNIVDKFWVMDKRGIVLIGLGNAYQEIVVPAEDIPEESKEWFNNYVNTLEYPSDGFIEDEIEPKEEQFFLFDNSYFTNSLLFDKHKFPYHKKLADYIMQTEGTIGIPLFDILYYYDEDKIRDYEDIEQYIKQEADPLITNISSISNIGPTYINNIVNNIIDNKDDYIYNKDNYIYNLYFDLSQIEFNKPKARPFWDSCDEEYNSKLHYWSQITNPLDYNQVYYSDGYIENNVLGWRPDGGTIESYWSLQTPYFCGNFTRDSRIYMEYMGGNSLCNFSQIYVNTFASIPSTISLGHDIWADKELLCFAEGSPHNSLAYHFFKDGQFENDYELVKTNNNLNHNLLLEDIENGYEIEMNDGYLLLKYMEDGYEVKIDDDLDNDLYDDLLELIHKKKNIIGNDRLLGDCPSYENGIMLTDIISYLCKYGTEYVNYEEKIKYPEKIGNNSYEILLDKISCIFKIFINIKYTGNYKGEKNKLSIIIGGKLITNISITRMSTGDTKVISCLIGYYEGDKIILKLDEEIDSNIEITKVTLWNFIDYIIDEYKIESEQPSVVFDRSGRVLIFYYNEIDNNISAVMSCDHGKSWTPYHNLIRLIGDEYASLPYVISDYSDRRINLFYVLNGKFLMNKKIESNLFTSIDSFKEYKRLDRYLTVEDISEYSDSGKILRASTSYFVEGDSDSQYYRQQKAIFKAMEDENEENKEIDFSKIPRFSFNEDNENNLNNDFDNKSYFIYQDNYGNDRLFYLKDNKLNIKKSSDKINWRQDVSDINIHKNFIDDDLNMKEFAISSIQIAKFEFNNNVMGLIYIYNGMMFIRYLQSDLLMNSQGLREHLSITNNKNSNIPIFLVGELSDEIKISLKEDFDNEIKYEDSNRLVYFPYEEDMIDKFNNNFAIDDSTQPCAYKLRKGFNRIFYKDINGNLNALLINGVNNITLECMIENKDKDENE